MIFRTAAVLSALTFLVPTSSSAAQTTTESKATTQVTAILARPAFKHASVGVFVRSLKDGNVLYERNADLSLVPASNQKILTAATALRSLGTGFRFRTAICTAAKPNVDGVLNGDLFLRGSGDPSLTTARLEELARSMAKSGIKRIIGRIIGDASAFDAQVLGDGWQWDDETYYYSAQVSGLNCDENVVEVTIRPGTKAGEPAIVLVNGRPVGEETYVAVDARISTVAGGSNVSANISYERDRGTNHVVIRGTIPVGAKEVTESITVENPARFTASRFVLALTKAGIVVDAPLWIETLPTPMDAVEIAATESKPLPDLLKEFLKPSDNLYGEALMKAIGRGSRSESPGSIRAGSVKVTELLDAAKIERGGLQIADGSGLSVQNTVTPRLIGDLLFFIDTQFSADEKMSFEEGLPVGGTDGTLRNRFKGTPVAGKVRGKTGTLSGASSLSGYLVAKSGTRFVFSILMNHSSSATEARQAQDAIVTALYNEL